MLTRHSLTACIPRVLLFCALGLFSVEALGGGVGVPPTVQAKLISKVPAYDRAFRKRVGSTVHVMIVKREESAESVRVANYLASALRKEHDIAGLPHDVRTLKYRDAATIAKEVRQHKISVLYLTPGFESDLQKICDSTQPLEVLTVTAVPEYVSRCVVLGFKLVAGKPKILVHLPQAKKNGIQFSSELLKLAEVHQ